MSNFDVIGNGLYVYQFPEFTKDSITRESQCEKIIEEANEHKVEVELGNTFASLVELIDTLHAAETSLRAGFKDGTYTDEMFKQAKLYTLLKNARRGYYNKQTCNGIEFARILCNKNGIGE